MTWDYCDACNAPIERDQTIAAKGDVVCCCDECLHAAPRIIAARNALALALVPDEDESIPTPAETGWLIAGVAIATAGWMACLAILWSLVHAA